MKNKFLLSIIFCFGFYSVNAQQIIWQNTIKGNNSDGIYSVYATSDGAVICGGSSNSGAAQDKSDPSFGGIDFWIVKLDTAGVIEWDKTIGGDNYDQLKAICQTPDGGFYCGGISLSGISGVKTEPNMGEEDFWVVRLDATGNIIWQNTIGGNLMDELNDLILTPDGGVLCGGVSKSGISGDKTEAGMGAEDFWLVKLDSTGAIQWQNTIGGNDRDWMNSVANTPDGGYICGGYSNSNSSGDKTHNSQGAGDYWIVKLDSLGNIEWDRTIGANLHDELFKVLPTPDGGYVCGGESNSLASGHKSETRQAYDFWIVKLNSIGQLQWENTLVAGSGTQYAYDYLRDMVISDDGGIICGGTSDSFKTKDKTENSNGGFDYWVVKLDSFGNILWQNTIGGNRDDYFNSMDINPQGELFIGGYSDSDLSGDKTEWSSWMNDDYWVLKLNTIFNQMSGTVFHDANSNALHDMGETPIPYRKVSELNSGVFTYTDFDGDYILQVADTGTLTAEPLLENIYFNPVPAQHSILFTDFNNIENDKDFAFQNAGLYDDLCLEFTATSPFRPGFNASYMVEYSNAGTTTQNAFVVFYLDNGISFVNSIPAPSNIYQDSVIFDLGALSPFQMGNIWISVHVDFAAPLGSNISSSALIIPVINDFNPVCNQDTATAIVTGAYDPNDITVDRTYLYNSEIIANQTYLEYLIRFQNTGNDTAFYVRIDNVLPADLNELDFELINTSHSCQVNYNPYDSTMRFSFYNILLPDSNINELMSHGFVKYRIKPKSNLIVGDSILNQARIIFDYNSPVITNTAITEVILPTSIDEPVSRSSIIVFPNPASSLLNVYVNSIEMGKKNLFVNNIYGQKLLNLETDESGKAVLDLSSVAAGIYFLQTEGPEKVVTRFVKY